MNLEQPLTLFNLIQTFESGGIYIVLFVVALLYLHLKGTDADKKVFVYTALFLLLTIFNPFFISLAMKVVPNEKSTYYRYIWLLPVLIVIAYSTVKLLMEKFSKKQKVSIVCVIVLLTVLFGSPVTNEIWVQGKPENIYKIPDSVLATCTIIENNKEEEQTTAIFANAISGFVRQYDKSIQMPFVHYPAYVSNVASEILLRPLANLKIITIHLGNGSSMCAVKNGKSIDTTMGFTPLEGLIMGTRCGDIDASVLEYIS
ncbi:MAG: hypothetical protein RR292_07805, partial [Christensenellaceae bacterium]